MAEGCFIFHAPQVRFIKDTMHTAYAVSFHARSNTASLCYTRNILYKLIPERQLQSQLHSVRSTLGRAKRLLTVGIGAQKKELLFLGVLGAPPG